MKERQARPSKRKVPNAAGREGKPMSLYPLSFDDAVKGLLATPSSKHEATKKKRYAQTKTKPHPDKKA